MRKIILFTAALALIIIMGGCSQTPATQQNVDLESPEAAPTENVSEELKVTDAPESPEPSNEPIEEDTESYQIFRDFLSENYDKLTEASFKSIAGIGFIDLDNDGVREMILFDAGASASMGVQIFEIVDGQVRCVCANIDSIAEAFGGKTSDIIVNANFMEDFRLLENKATGERFFVVESKNGNIESVYSELIRFGTGEGGLTLTSAFYKYEEYDVESGDVSLQRFKIGAEDADQAGYEAALDKFYQENEDTGLECRGVFVWENSEYTENYKSFMENVDKALELYDNNRMQ